MRRLTLILSLALACSVSGGQAWATGPGGWENLGGGVADTVSAVNTDLPGQVLVGGRDLNAGGNANADHLAGWNGTSWVQYGGATDLGSAAQAVHAIAVSNGKIYAGGSFTTAGGAVANGLAVWDTAAPGWQSFCVSSTAGSFVVDALEIIGNTLYVGGAFDTANSNPAAENLVACDLGTGAMSATVDDDGDIGGRVQALAADSNGHLYAGGQFINVNVNDVPSNDDADYIAKFLPGSGWVALPDALGNAPIDTANVDAVATSGTDLFVGGDDTDIAALPDADHVAKWNGSSWSALGTSFFPVSAAIEDLLVNGSTVYATGAFNDAGGDDHADGIAQFSGSWQPMGSEGFPPGDDDDGPLGPNGAGDGNALALLSGSVIVGGAFTDAGGDTLADRAACFGTCPSPAIQTPTPPPVTTTAAPTGLRAAALKKCKKKPTAVKRKKCRKKANALPV